MSEISTIEKKSIGYAIYKNLPKLCEAKNIKLDNYTKMDILEFNNKKEANGLFAFEGTFFGPRNEGKKENKKVWMALITTGSKYLKAAELNKYINNITADQYFVITDVKKKIKINGNVQIIDGSKCCIKNLSKTFAKKGYKYQVLPRDKTEFYKKILFLHNDNIFPGIMEADPLVVWSTAKVGDLIEIHYPTLTSAGITGCIREVRRE